MNERYMMFKQYIKQMPYNVAYQAISLYAQIDHNGYIWLIELIESFKKNKIARGIEQVNTEILAFLKSKDTSLQITQYFKISDIKQLPFVNFELEPNNISQIKKLVNALYHAQLTFNDLERIDIRSLSSNELKSLFEKTIESAYEASYLATQVDIDLKSIFFELKDVFFNLQNVFKEEREFINPYLRKIPLFTNPIHKQITARPKTDSFSYITGQVSGKAADQMRPIGGDIDYNFLTKFTGYLPGYINTLREKITKYRLEIRDQHKEMNQERLDTIQGAVNQLLSDIETLKENSIFIPVKFLSCIHVINNIALLVMESITQLGHLNTETEDSIFDKLDKLKYNLLPTLFGLIDNIEVNLLLKPGCLSIPLMEEVKKLYQVILYFPEKFVNFKEKREDLLSVENSRFVALRLKLAYQRINAANTVLHKIHESQNALTDFFDELSKSEYRDLCLHQLPVPVKTKLIEHYALIKPYMMQVDIDFNKQIITGLTNAQTSWSSYLATPLRGITGMVPEDHISLILAKQQTVQILILKNQKTQLFHINMNEDLINSVHRQTNFTLSPYTEKTNVYVIDESTSLHLEEDQFINSTENTLIKNPEQLTADQALVLWEWYEDKYYKFRMAKKAYTTFYDELNKDEVRSSLLNQMNPNNGIIQPTKIKERTKLPKHRRKYASDLPEIINDVKIPTELISKLNSVHKDHLRHFNTSKLRDLYSVFQHYFVCAVSPELKKPILEQLDKYLVALLSNKSVRITDDTLIEEFLKLHKPIQDYFAQTKVEWDLRSKIYFQLAQKKSGSEHQAAQLICTENNDQRAHYLTRVSEEILNFRAELSNISQLFNNSIKQQLQPQKSYRTFPGINDLFPDIEEIEQELKHQQSVVPFPEMEDMNQQLAQSKQVRAIKDIHNNFFHLEEIILELLKLNHENIQNSSSVSAKGKKIVYVSHLITAYTHINQIIQLSQRLATDPHCKFIFNELINKAQNFYAVLQEQTDAYQASPTTKTIDNFPLWYSLNAFYNAPTHIRSVRNINFRSIEECKELSQQAENSSVIIQEIIKNSNSYFKLFLQAPNMIFLYHELVGKLNDFTTTSHDAVLDNLDKMRSAIFTPILIEADNWEYKLGLVPGILSDPLRKITDEYYKGFLDALQLDSKKHITLICDTSSLEKRIEHTKKQCTEATESREKANTYYADIIVLQKLMLQYKNLGKKGIYPVLNRSILEALEERIRTGYLEVLPKLAQLKLDKKISIECSINEEDHLFDTFCNAGLKEYDPHFTEIEALVTASGNYFLGLKATYETKINTATEKLEYLSQLKSKHPEETTKFILTYTEKAYEKHLKKLCNSHHVLQYTDEEYDIQLEAYLRETQTQIINASKSADDINLTIVELLKEKINAFEKERFEQYYHLDSVRVAIAQFKVYINEAQMAFNNKHSLFESNTTIYEKSTLITELEIIAKNTELSLEERIKQIKYKVVVDPNFKRIILKYKQADKFFTYLAICFISLLEALHLYAPSKSKLLENINEKLQSPLKYQELTTRFGLFTPAPTAASKNPHNETEARTYSGLKLA